VLPPNYHALRADATRDEAAAVSRRQEDVAISHFNRLVRNELDRRAAHVSGRRGKRYSRYVKRKTHRRRMASLTKYRIYRRQYRKMMNYVQYRSRKGAGGAQQE
jgi:hypothetical protein